jgi:hypothetical protein
METQTLHTTDSNGNQYKKFRIPEVGNSVVCLRGTNTHYRGIPNVSIRTGPSIFGKEIVIQLDVNQVVTTYPAKSGFDSHIEIYLKEDQAIKLLTPLLESLTGKKETPEMTWNKNICDRCGKGHLYCEECKTYTWKTDEQIESYFKGTETSQEEITK